MLKPRRIGNLKRFTQKLRNVFLDCETELGCKSKAGTHDQICIRMQFCIYAKFAYVRKSGHVYAFTHVCKICTYAKVEKFAPASDQVQISFCVYAKFAFMQIWSCEQKAKFAHVSIYLIVLYNCWNNIVSRLELSCLLFNLTKSCASLFLKLFYQSLIKFSSCSGVILAKYCNFYANIQTNRN